MVINLMSLGLDTTPEVKSAQSKIERALAPFSAEQLFFTSFDNEKNFLEALSKSVSRDDIIVLAADKNLYIPFKNFIMKAFQLKKRSNRTASKLLKTKLPVDADYVNDDLFAMHGVFPVGCTLMLSEDGMYSGFAVEANNQIVIVLPFDDDRIETILQSSVIPYLSEKTGIELVKSKLPYDEKTVKNAVNLLAENGLRFAVAKTKTVDFIENVSINTADLSKVAQFTDFYVEKGDLTPREYAVKLAEGALNASENCQLGVSITKVFTVSKDEGTEMFLYVCIADKDNANAVKLFAEPGETPPQLIYSAVEELFKMLGKWASVREIVPKVQASAVPNAERTPKSDAKTKITFILLVAIALIVSLLLAFYYAGSGALNEKISGYLHASDIVKSVNVTLKNADAEGEDDYEYNNNGGVDISGYLTLYAAQKTETTAAVSTSAAATTKAATSSKTTSKIGTSTAATTASAAKSGSYPDTLLLGGNQVETKYAIARIVEGEMGSGFEPEALKAQAVAAFTYIKKNNWDTSGMSCSKTYSAKALSAAEAVLGEYAAYNGSTALTVFFAMSAGKTVCSTDVWKSASGYPYLKGGIASNDKSEEKSTSKYQTTKTYTSGQLKTLIESTAGVTLNDDPSTWIKINKHDGAVSDSIGYVSSMTVGGKEMTGNYFRTTVLSYGIRSQCFTVSFDNASDTFTFTVYGYGHGVGMSQCGANYLAKQGYTYENILKYYYPGITLVKS